MKAPAGVGERRQNHLGGSENTEGARRSGVSSMGLTEPTGLKVGDGRHPDGSFHPAGAQDAAHSVLPAESLRAPSVSPWYLRSLRPALLSLAVGVIPAAGLVLAVSVLSSPAAAAGATAGPSVQLQTTLSGERAKTAEAEAGNLIADALRAATSADLALVAAGELRDDSLPPGTVTTAQLQRLLTNGDEPVTVLSLSGATLRNALEVGISAYPRKSKGFLQVSGLTFVFDPARPEGSRVVAATAAGQPMQDGRQYRVAMSSSLASGQYGYYRLWSREKGAAAQGLTMESSLEQYLRGKQTVAPRIEGRIVVKAAR
jgi:5'-nucleotidase-like protein